MIYVAKTGCKSVVAHTLFVKKSGRRHFDYKAQQCEEHRADFPLPSKICMVGFNLRFQQLSGLMLLILA